MPKINRIRFVNLDFNNNTRKILDETLNFYECEDMLVNLENGGGKTTLVMAIFQPIQPLIYLGKRRVKDWFYRKTSPTYILIEWKLDHDKGYLLTGIALRPNTTLNQDDETESTGVKYFTFTFSYNEACQYDIKNFSFFDRDSEGLNKLKKYKEVRKELDSVKDGRLKVFDNTKSDKVLHHKELSYYGINADEFKSVLKKINLHEGGLTEIFEKIDTSQKVLEDWVLPYIEDVINKACNNENAMESLDKMMHDLAKELISREEDIKDRDSLKYLSEVFSDLSIESQEILKALEKSTSVQAVLFHLRNALLEKQKKLELLLGKNENKISDLDEELSKLTNEKISEEYYKSVELMNSLETEVKELDLTLGINQRNYDESIQEKNLINGSRIRVRIDDTSRQIAKCREGQNLASQCDDEKSIRLKNVKYSLKTEYNRINKMQNEQIRFIENNEKDINERISEIKQNIIDNELNISGYHEKIGALKNASEAFVDREIILFDEIGVQFYRNPFLGTISKEDINNVDEKINYELESLINKIDIKRKLVDEKERIISHKSDQLTTLIVNEGKLRTQINKMSDDIEQFKHAESQYKSLLIACELDNTMLFERDQIEKKLTELEDRAIKKQYKLMTTRKQFVEKVKRVNAGTSYISSELLELIRNSGIDITTGEQYLKTLPDDQAKNLIDKNPYLPYSLLMSKRELATLQKCLSSVDIEQLVPIIMHGEQEIEISKDFENIYLLMQSRDMSNDAEVICEMELKVESCKEELSFIEETIQYNKSLRFTFESFDYLKADVEKMFTLFDKTNIEIAQVTDEIEMTKFEINQFTDELEDLSKSIDQLNIQKEENETKKNSLNEYIKINHKYEEDISILSKIIKESDKLKDIVISDKHSLEEENDKLRVIDSEKIVINNQISEIAKKISLLGNVLDGEIIDNEIEELEGSHGALVEELGSDVRRYEDLLKQAEIALKNHYDDLEKLKVSYNDVKEVDYNESTLYRAESDIKHFSAEIDSLKTRKIETNTRIDHELSNIKNIESDSEFTILRKEEIKGDYTNRRRKIKIENSSINGENKKINKDLQIIVATLSDLKILLINYDESENPDNICDLELSIENIEKYILLYRQANDDVKDKMKMLNISLSKYDKSLSKMSEVAYKNFDAIKNQITQTAINYSSFYEVYELIEQYCENCINFAKGLDADLARLEDNKRNVSEFIFSRVNRIYNEIPKISEHSHIEVDGQRKKFLSIEIDKITSEEDEARMNVFRYVENALDSILKVISDSGDETKISKEIEKYLRSKMLLSTVININKTKVKIFKFDISEKNRGAIPWEESVKHSGGEKFLASFYLLVSLISYSRRSTNPSVKLSGIEDSITIIMDNPFGKVTSSHLLKPMFDFAKRYNTQLICFTDIRSKTVRDMFNLITVLEVKTDLKNNDHLHVNTFSKEDLQVNSKLEKVYLKSNYEQISLFK